MFPRHAIGTDKPHIRRHVRRSWRRRGGAYRRATDRRVSLARGLAATNAFVAVNGNEAYRAGDYFFGSDDFDNSTGGGIAELEVSAVVSAETNDFVSVATNRVFVPPASETYAYDADGNMTEDARFRYYWNGENRMIRAEEKDAPPDREPYVIAYAYDHMGRNVLKDGARYIWDDYNIIVENAASSNLVVNMWGLDVDGTMQGAGGVGGLLAVENIDAVYLSAYDGNGNVTEYVSEGCGIAAHYAYSAFGKLLMVDDPIGFSHRFSTKPTCSRSGMVEYEFRKYTPDVGRWRSRDGIYENLALGLYSACDNELLSFIDLLGYVKATPWEFAGDPNSMKYGFGKYIALRGPSSGYVSVKWEYRGYTCDDKEDGTDSYGPLFFDISNDNYYPVWNKETIDHYVDLPQSSAFGVNGVSGASFSTGAGSPKGSLTITITWHAKKSNGNKRLNPPNNADYLRHGAAWNMPNHFPWTDKPFGPFSDNNSGGGAATTVTVVSKWNECVEDCPPVKITGSMGNGDNIPVGLPR